MKHQIESGKAATLLLLPPLRTVEDLSIQTLKRVQGRHRCSVKKAEQRLTMLRQEKPDLFAYWYPLRAANV